MGLHAGGKTRRRIQHPGSGYLRAQRPQHQRRARRAAQASRRRVNAQTTGRDGPVRAVTRGTRRLRPSVLGRSGYTSMTVIEGKRRELMAAQLGVWYAQQLDPDGPVYNMGEYLEIHGDLDVDLFEIALRHTMSEAEAVHLRFFRDGVTLGQYVGESDDWPLHIIDVSSAADPRSAAEDWMWADMRRPVDLWAAPLFTQALFKAAPGRFFWYQRGHHIAVDAFSGSLIAARQAQIYTSLLAGELSASDVMEPFSVLLDA